MAVVYRHIRLDNNQPFYIGIGKTEKRAYQKFGRTKHWHNIVNKAGYKVQIMLDDLSWEEACEKEREFIQLYGRVDLGLGTLVNKTDGGEANIGIIVSAETRAKLSAAAKNMSAETRAKISAAMTGRVISEEWKAKLSIAGTGRIFSEESKAKMRKPKKAGHGANVSAALTGKKHSAEHRANQSAGQKARWAKKRIENGNI